MKDECVEEAQDILTGSTFFKDMPNPSETDLTDPVFNAIWEATKTWDVNAPEYYAGYCGMNGSHIKLILDAIKDLTE